MSRLGVPATISVGSDFSGLDAGVVALRRMRVPLVLKFSCDSLPASKAFITSNHMPDKFFDDVAARTQEEEEYVDLYLFTPPCTTFSKSGKQQGTSKREGQVMKYSMKYIQRNKPRLAVMENVKNLASTKFRHVLNGVLKCFDRLGYVTHHEVLNARTFRCPQSRERLFLIAIRRDSVARAFQWPRPLGRLNFSACMDPVAAPAIDRPGRLPRLARSQTLVRQAFKKCLDNGVNPMDVPILVDIDCSHKFAIYGVNIAKTLTKSRGQAGGPWISTRGRRTTISEMLRIQGFSPPEVPWQECAIARTVIGGMIGNSIPVPMLGCVLAEGLYAAGLVAAKPAWR